MRTMDYQIKTEQFEGPVHVLLELIEERKMHVSEVSLAAVTEDFLRFMNERELAYGDVTSFIVVASTLVLIKARSLLPQMELTEEEEASIDDLTERIRQYQIVQKYAQHLASGWHKRVSYERAWTDKAPVFAPDPQMTVANFASAMEDMFRAFPVAEKLPERAIKTVVGIDEMIRNLTRRVQEGVAYSSRAMMERYANAKDPSERREAKVFAVVSFLAILELVKKGIASVMQNAQFADIELEQPHPSPLLQGEGAGQ